MTSALRKSDLPTWNSPKQSLTSCKGDFYSQANAPDLPPCPQKPSSGPSRSGSLPTIKCPNPTCIRGCNDPYIDGYKTCEGTWKEFWADLRQQAGLEAK